MSTRLAIALVVGIVILNVVAIISSQIVTNDSEDNNDIAQEQQISDDQTVDENIDSNNENDNGDTNTGEVKGNGDIDEGGLVTKVEANEGLTADEKAKATQELMTKLGKWIPIDYEEGDIQGDTHEVVGGDTLWEIAEAYYGNGAQWTQILELNKGDIGFLANGQQALIIPGQVLQLN